MNRGFGGGGGGVVCKGLLCSICEVGGWRFLKEEKLGDCCKTAVKAEAPVSESQAVISPPEALDQYWRK